MTTTPTRAAIYTRISDDREGREVGVTAQADDCRDLAKRLGWTLAPDPPHPVIRGRVPQSGPVYCDNDAGASTLSRKRRPEYEALLEAVKAGQIDGIVYWSNSRLTRRPLEYAAVEELVKDTGVRLASVKSGEVDLSTADGRMIGGILARIDAAEAERISERVKRRWQTRREGGQAHSTGTRPFGWADDGVTVDPDEAAAIRAGAEMILAGASLGMVVRAWTDGREVADEHGPAVAPVKPPTGGQWSRTTVRRALTRPRVAGLIEFRGKIENEGHPGAFGILPVAVWRDVRAAVSDRSGLVRARYQGRAHLLAGFMTCGFVDDQGKACGHNMKVSARRDEDGNVRADSFVACQKDWGGCGHVKRNLLLTERFVLAAVEERLARVGELVVPDDADDAADVARLVAERDGLLVKIDRLHDQYVTEDLDAADFVPLARKLRDRLGEVEALLDEHAEPRPELGPDPLAAWQSGTFDERRELLSAVVETVVLAPIGNVGPDRSRALVPERTTIHWR